ncbi:MAG: hypothetical protein JXQ90_12405 [Cyclobacteriaceae bacterium]
MLLFVAEVSYAQLITDSDARLKMLKVEKKPKSPGLSATSGPGQGVRGPAPRYSGGNPYGGVLSVKSPRYSKDTPWQGVQLSKIKYSKGNPFGGVLSVSPPKYSKGNPYDGVLAVGKPKYSEGNPFHPSDYKIKPRYSPTTNFSLYNFTMGWKYMRYGTLAAYEGPYKIKRSIHPASHPAANLQTSRLRRPALFWANISNRGNKYQPNAVTQKVKEPDFDKKEKDIWNN